MPRVIEIIVKDGQVIPPALLLEPGERFQLRVRAVGFPTVVQLPRTLKSFKVGADSWGVSQIATAPLEASTMLVFQQGRTVYAPVYADRGTDYYAAFGLPTPKAYTTEPTITLTIDGPLGIEGPDAVVYRAKLSGSLISKRPSLTSMSSI